MSQIQDEPITTHAPRFLLLRGGAIGDFIVTLPVLQALRGHWPGAYIEIWGYPHVAELAVLGGLARKVVSLDRAEMSRFFVPEPSFTDAQVAAIRSFDLVFNYLHDPVGQVRSNLLLAGAKQVLSGSPIIKRGHAVPFLLEPLQDLALYDDTLVPVLDLPEASRAAGRARLKGLGLKGRPLVVHPGSGSPTKNWPLERFLDVVERMRRAGQEVVLVLGEADAELSRRVTECAPEVPRLEGLTLMELAEALSECGEFLGNDSGITHLAAALGLSLTVLFGPTDPGTWTPRGRGKIRVLRPPEGDLMRLSVDDVLAAL